MTWPRTRRDPPALTGIERMASMNILGVILQGNLSITMHVNLHSSIKSPDYFIVIITIIIILQLITRLHSIMQKKIMNSIQLGKSSTYPLWGVPSTYPLWPPVRCSKYLPHVRCSKYLPPVRCSKYLPPVRCSKYLPPVRCSKYLPPVRCSKYLPPVRCSSVGGSCELETSTDFCYWICSTDSMTTTTVKTNKKASIQELTCDSLTQILWNWP